MATEWLSIHDRNNLGKSFKLFLLKATQIIVQSRLGEKINTKSKLHSSAADCFHLNIYDINEIRLEAKKALSGDILKAKLTMCIEISIQTNEGVAMVLEVWRLCILPDQCETCFQGTYTIYNRMCVILKALLTITRVTPAYKLSRRQGSDSYVICYRVFVGEPQSDCLGEGSKQILVGELCTPIGKLNTAVTYRTKMTISPQHIEKDISLMLKSDHFCPDLSPRRLQCQWEEENELFIKKVKVGAFVDTLPPTASDLIMPHTPFSCLLTRHQNIPSLSSGPMVGIETFHTDNTDEVKNINKDYLAEICASNADSKYSSCSIFSTDDGYAMVDLKTPFRKNNSFSDLGLFFKEFQSAPPLKVFSEQPTLAEQIEVITKSLEIFEINMKEYDKVFNELFLSDKM